jgi:hypothetical protein
MFQLNPICLLKSKGTPLVRGVNISRSVRLFRTVFPDGDRPPLRIVLMHRTISEAVV